MYKMRQIIILSLFLLLLSPAFSQEKTEPLMTENTEYHTSTFYTSLVHQHQNFFQKPFSYQGIETGFSIHDKLNLGIYGASFISNLFIHRDDHPLYLFISQGGLFGGRVINTSSRFHIGGQLNIGLFSLAADPENFGLFKTKNKQIKIHGVILAQQFYGEINITGWLKLRTGVAYTFYTYEDQSKVSKKELQNTSVVFGFVFGKFIKNK